jgi:hypothetical protein
MNMKTPAACETAGHSLKQIKKDKTAESMGRIIFVQSFMDKQSVTAFNRGTIHDSGFDHISRMASRKEWP